MAGSVFDSPLYARLFPAGEAGKLFTDSAEVRAMLLVEGTLAKVQGEAGVIPEISAKAIHRASLEIPLDPGDLAGATGQNGVTVPGLVAAFRKAMEAPEHAQYVHWGATSQDIMDTGLMLRMRAVLDHAEAQLAAILSALADLAEAHADTPMAARTYGQHATPTSFGACAAQWGAPLLDLRTELPALRGQSLWVSLSGAAGTASELGADPAALRTGLAAGLGLSDPGRSWHADRGPILRLADWFARLTTALAKVGSDMIFLVNSDTGEVHLGAAGGSSTMPQKQNPVQPSVLVALARQTTAMQSALHAAGVHGLQRDGAAWFTEWLTLPQLTLSALSALETAAQMLPGITPDADRMATALAASDGMIHAEALSFALATEMPRPEAQAVTKTLCREARETGTPLADLVARDWPQLDTGHLFTPARQMGTAPDEARRFAKAVRAAL